VTVLVASCAFALCLTGFNVASRGRVGGHRHALLHLLLIFTDVSSFFVLGRSFQLVSQAIHMVSSNNDKVWVWISLQFDCDSVLDRVAGGYEVF
jgi:hypothetical protein